MLQYEVYVRTKRRKQKTIFMETTKIQADPTKKQFSVLIFLVRRGSENANPAFRKQKTQQKPQKQHETKTTKKPAEQNHVMALTRKAWRIVKFNYLDNKG